MSCFNPISSNQVPHWRKNITKVWQYPTMCHHQMQIFQFWSHLTRAYCSTFPVLNGFWKTANGTSYGLISATTSLSLFHKGHICKSMFNGNVNRFSKPEEQVYSWAKLSKKQNTRDVFLKPKPSSDLSKTSSLCCLRHSFTNIGGLNRTDVFIQKLSEKHVDFINQYCNFRTISRYFFHTILTCVLYDDAAKTISVALVRKRRITTNRFSCRLKYVLFSNQTRYPHVLMPYCKISEFKEKQRTSQIKTKQSSIYRLSV